jgi:hypothetical protein
MHFLTFLAIVHVAFLRSSWRSCFMRATLVIMRATNSSLVFNFLSIDFAFYASPQTKIGSVRANFKQLYLLTHWKLDTCLYELIYSEQSILPPPKLFNISPEISCILRKRNSCLNSATAPVWITVSVRGICGGQNDTVTSICPNTSVFPVDINPEMFHILLNLQNYS